MKKLILLPFTLILFSLAYAQVTIDWQMTYGGSDDETLSDLILTPGGVPAFSGSSKSSDGDLTANNGGFDYWMAGLFVNNQISWQKSLGGTLDDFGQKILFDANNDILMIGTALSNDGDVGVNIGSRDLWVNRSEFIGNVPTLDWESTFGGTSLEFASDFVATSDGGYVILSTTQSNDIDVSGNNGATDVWLIKINGAGTIQWQNCLGGSDIDGASSVKETSDGGYIIAGSTYSVDSGISNNGVVDGLVTKVDASGSLVWRKNYGGSQYDGFNDVVNTHDGGYVLIGSTQSSDGDIAQNNGLSDIWVVKLDPLGNLEWEQNYGGTNNDNASSIINTMDGGYLFAGSTLSNDGDINGANGMRDAWVVKINSEGVLRWQEALGGSANDYAKQIIQLSDGSYVIGADTESNDGDVTNNNGQRDIWLVKLDVACTSSLAAGHMLNGANISASASAPEGANYQWFNCTDSTIIAGANSKEYTATQNGEYAFIVSDGACVDTSICIEVTDAVGIQELSILDFKLHPNPANDFIQISTSHEVEQIEVYNFKGELVGHEKETSFSVQEWSTGMYILKIITNKGIVNVKLLKQ